MGRLCESDGQPPFHTMRVAQSINDHRDLLAADFRSCCTESAKIYQRIEKIQKPRDTSKSVLDKPKCRTFDGTMETLLKRYKDVYSLIKEAGLKSVKRTLRELKQLIVKYIQSRGEMTGQALSVTVYDRLPRYITERLRGGKAAYPEWNGLLSASDDIYLEKEANEVLPTRKEAAAQQKKVAAAAALPPEGAGAQTGPAPQGGEKKKRIRRKEAKAEKAAEAAVAAGVNVGKKPQHTKSKEDKPKERPDKPCNGCPSCRNTWEQHVLSKRPSFAAIDLDNRRACTSQNYRCIGKCPRKKEACGGVRLDGGKCQKSHHPLLHNPPKRN